MRGLIAIASVILIAQAGFAAEPTESITVNGAATVFVKPDAARIHYAIRVSDASVDAAKDTAIKQAASMNESVKALKLTNLTTSTGAITYSRSTFGRGPRGAAFPGGPGGGGPGGGGAPGLGTHGAQLPFTTTIVNKDPEKLRTTVDTFIAKIVDAGATVSGDNLDPDSPFVSAQSALTADAPRIEWFLTDDSAARRDAYRTALRKAKGDAETLSKDLGWEKLTILSVADGPASSRDPFDANTAPPRAPAGEVAISARVVLKCSR